MDTNTKLALDILQNGNIIVKGEFLWGSNYTFLAQIEHNGNEIPGVYKPIKGERPLWDFPAASLCKREIAAFLVSEALGWRFVPPTVYRKDAPLGSGSLQLFVEHDPEYHYFNFTSNDLNRLKPVVLFDIIINNADRKGSHVLIDPEDRLWLIDHGVCFHVENKLRSVIWDFVGMPIPDEFCVDIENFINCFGKAGEQQTQFERELNEYLSRSEIKSMQRRAKNLIQSGRFPPPDPYRRPFPWPQI